MIAISLSMVHPLQRQRATVRRDQVYHNGAAGEDQCVTMSASGTKPTLACAPHMSAIEGKADMAVCTARVRL